ncbi:hypothetical protein PILCRDRAFT_813428 [Piloderma croceum F 1598]|uniref:Uncharacterized protein n=1 Tax=Piloderma croceum (strain F 1598) TaxID=765440 RepID=A0A0C3GFT2_PILCF|nr:hypothetical protein PILCRDRAFT_813428 [Piloderma croceum F 1598]
MAESRAYNHLGTVQVPAGRPPCTISSTPISTINNGYAKVEDSVACNVTVVDSASLIKYFGTSMRLAAAKTV